VDLAGTLSQKLGYQGHGTNLDGKYVLLWVRIRGSIFLNQSSRRVALDKSQGVGTKEGWGTWGSLGNHEGFPTKPAQEWGQISSTDMYHRL
jgi:hypothetical protein